MEHPFLLLPWLMDKVHLYFFTNVVYSWFIMLFLLVVAKLAVGTVKMIPSGGQNFFELVLGGFEDFMLDVMGHEGKPFFPFNRHVISLYFVYELDWFNPGHGFTYQ